MAGPFELSLRAFAEKAGANADRVVHDTVIEVFQRVVERTPVGMPETWKTPAPVWYRPGQAKANWSPSTGTPANGTLMLVDPSGAVTKDKIEAFVPAKASGQTFFLTNSLPYIWPLEHGWSAQAPSGMVGLTVIEFDTIVREKTAALVSA